MNQIKFSLIIYGLFNFFKGIVGFFLAFYLYNYMNFSGTQIGVLFAIDFLVSIFSAYIIGRSCDRLPVKYVAFSGLFLYAIFFTGISFNLTYLQYTILFLFSGLGNSMFRRSIETFNLKQKEAKHGFHFGLVLASDTIPFSFGLVLGGVLFNLLNFPLVFRFVSIGFFLISLLTILYLPKTKEIKIGFSTYFKDVFNHKLLILLIAITLFSLHIGAEITSYSLLLDQRFNLDSLQIGIFTGIPVFFLGVFAILIGKSYDLGFLKLKSIMFFGLLFSGLGFILFSISTNVYISLILRILHEIGDGAFLLFSFLSYSVLFKSDSMGGDTGIIETIKTISIALFAIFFGFIGGKYGFHVPHIISGIAMLSTIPLFMYLYRKMKVKEKVKN
jgi:MFS family permease